MQIFLTILAGAGTFVIGQIFMKLVIDPVHNMKLTIADISNALILYANIYANPRHFDDEQQMGMSSEMRILSSKLQSKKFLVPYYFLMSKIFGLPCLENINTASKNLIKLHNGHDHILANQGLLNAYSAQKIKIALGIYISPEDFLKPELEENLIKVKND